ncbi:Hpt domain-containing protein [Paraburkholderia rhizosphaerae]|uniref:Hpt domain-containing protein n=1 Tax=Paraburkholderia rhizosphaerae TaxID=480658 RepID=A0A4R8M0E0_9BURK|nr:Hpt domain-containing protein [Paraburkholderia rhizosphaerae]TDY54550.1 Hpt domain-containing protein [Paraburkholderia rhizosphaerae]
MSVNHDEKSRRSSLARSANTQQDDEDSCRWSDLIHHGPADLRELLIETTLVDLHDAIAALNTGDFARAKFIAHRMKGIARILNADETVSACGALEMYCHRCDATRAGAALLQVELGFAAVYRTFDGSDQTEPSGPSDPDD